MTFFCLIFLVFPWKSDLKFLFFFPQVLQAANFGTSCSALLFQSKRQFTMQISIIGLEILQFVGKKIFLNHLRACWVYRQFNVFCKKSKGCEFTYLSKALKHIKHLKHWDWTYLIALLYLSHNDYCNNLFILSYFLSVHAFKGYWMNKLINNICSEKRKYN